MKWEEHVHLYMYCTCTCTCISFVFVIVGGACVWSDEWTSRLVLFAIIMYTCSCNYTCTYNVITCNLRLQWMVLFGLWIWISTELHFNTSIIMGRKECRGTLYYTLFCQYNEDTVGLHYTFYLLYAGKKECGLYSFMPFVSTLGSWIFMYM